MDINENHRAIAWILRHFSPGSPSVIPEYVARTRSWHLVTTSLVLPQYRQRDCCRLLRNRIYPGQRLARRAGAVHPNWRASAMGVYRLWRDSDYAFGALLAGILTDAWNISRAIGLIAFLPLIAGIIIAFRMKETLKK